MCYVPSKEKRKLHSKNLYILINWLRIEKKKITYQLLSIKILSSIDNR